MLSWHKENLDVTDRKALELCWGQQAPAVLDSRDMWRHVIATKRCSCTPKTESHKLQYIVLSSSKTKSYSFILLHFYDLSNVYHVQNISNFDLIFSPQALTRKMPLKPREHCWFESHTIRMLLNNLDVLSIVSSEK